LIKIRRKHKQTTVAGFMLRLDDEQHKLVASGGTAKPSTAVIKCIIYQFASTRFSGCCCRHRQKKKLFYRVLCFIVGALAALPPRIRIRFASSRPALLSHRCQSFITMSHTLGDKLGIYSESMHKKSANPIGGGRHVNDCVGNVAESNKFHRQGVRECGRT
jgi:hypothetical protein